MDQPTNTEEIQADLKTYSALESVAASEGGQQLIDSYIKDVVATVNTLCLGYKKLTHMELVAYCAALSEKLDVVHTLTRSTKNKDLATEALKDALAL